MSNQNDLIASDINEYLSQHEHKEMLRLLTCGNVDDGKSTLIGRMLYDSKMIFEDQLAAVESDSVKHGTTGEKLDLALLVDGLAAEREQGITIDVAYRYFSTTKRKFIIADTPGHEQYTRNMATGASTCDLAIILIDARHGVQTQTKRHSFIASLLGIKHVVVAVNKMDLVDFSEDRYEEIKADYKNFVEDLDIEDFHFVPLSALNGDNVVNRSELSPWYTGQTLMEVLENVEISKDKNLTDFRMPVQYVNRPNLNFRGFAGNIASGIIKPGDSITALPSGKSSTVKSIVTYDGDLQEAFAGQAVTLTLNDEIDISRGDMIVKTDNQPATATRFNANIVWMTEAALAPGKVYDIKMASLAASGTFAKVHYQVDVNTMLRNDASELKLNEIGLCELTLNKEVAFDPYKANRATGSFIIIDRLTNVTVGAGMIVDAVEGSDDLAQAVTAEERAARFGQQAASLYFTGETKQAQAIALERRLFSMGHATALLTPDSLGGNADEKLGEKLTQAINQAGLIALCTFDAPVDAFVVGADTSTDDVIAQLQSKGII